jgi:hypothetical protein
MKIREAQNMPTFYSDNLNYREIFNKSIFNNIQKFFKNQHGIRSILTKIIVLDSLDRSNLWSNNLRKIVKNIVSF